jgi:hypothetical protein
MEKDAHSISEALFEFMHVHGSYSEFMSMEHNSITTTVIQQIVTEFSRPTKPVINPTVPDHDILIETFQQFTAMVRYYLRQQDACFFGWMDCIYWATHAANTGIFYLGEGKDLAARSIESMTIVNIKKDIALDSDHLFDIMDHKIFRAYPGQCFVKIFDLWFPLTPTLRRSSMFYQYSIIRPELRSWRLEQIVESNTK